MSTPHETGGLVVALNPPRRDAQLITFCWAVHDHLENNPHLPNPRPTLADFAADIRAFQEAEVMALGRSKGTAAARNARRRRVHVDLRQLRDYVQASVDLLADPVAAAAVIERAFMSVKRRGNASKPPLRAVQLAVGVVALRARAVARTATYFWEISLDGETWTRARETHQANTVIEGLLEGRRYYFRFRAITRKEPVDYSQVVTLIVG